jgi:hypothetical protein
LTQIVGRGTFGQGNSMKPFAYFRRVDWFVVIVAILIAGGCGGGGCSGCGISPIPGGFSFAKRTSNAGQVRVSTSGIAKITADPAALLGPLLGTGSGGTIEFPAPVSCSGTKICCDDNGNAIPNCGPIDIDLTQMPGDAARLALTPNGTSALNVQILARVKTVHPLAVTLSFLGLPIHCTIAIDTTKVASPPDMKVNTVVTFSQDANSVTAIAASGTAISQLDSGDLVYGGDFECGIGAIIPVSTITDQLVGPIESAINSATCKKCDPTITCGTGATCTSGTCTFSNGKCEQELGIDGRMAGSALFGSLSPGTTGGLDLYEVAGGYSLTNENGGGISLGLLGGMQAGGTPRDQCGPVSPDVTILPAAARSNYFAGNTRPDDNSAFDVAIGLHKSQLAELATGGYNGGLFCLTIGHNTVAQLTTDTIGLLSRSLGKLVETNSPMAIGLRPQSAPTIGLGTNTFTTSGMTRTLTDPLLDIKFTGMEIDFFAQINDQYIRVFTVVSDVHLPVGLDVGANGTLTPVLGDVSAAFTNVSVKNSDAVTETPADLAALFPTLLNLVLPQLSGGLSPISLPKLGGLELSVVGLTAVDDKDADGVGDYLGIFANLVPAAMAREHVKTTFDIASVEEPDAAIAKSPAKWRGARGPAVTLSLGAVAETRPLEFQIRVDEGSWTAWSPNPRPVLQPQSFWLPGVHEIEARARLVGDPNSADPVPAMLSVPLGTDLLPPPTPSTSGAAAGFHGQSGAMGCACNTGGGGGAAAPFALVVLGMMLPRLRRRARKLARSAMRLGPLVWLTALACLPVCSCDSKPCGNGDCMTGTQTGAMGRWTSIAGDDQRVMVATYDEAFGDLVIADTTDPTKITYKSVDGVPTDTAPTYDPSTWRGGIVDPGPKVGAWTSITLGDHKARVAYQDRDANALKYATEDDSHNWSSYVLDDGNGETTGLFTSILMDTDAHPVVAYMSIGGNDGMGHITSELKLARAGAPQPSEADWVITTVASQPASCAGLCGSGQSCIAGAAATDPQVCITPTSDCSAACASGDVCSAGACVTALPDPMLDDLPTGTGLFAKLMSLPDGRLAIAYYDQVRRALVLDVETARGTSTFAETIVDGNVAGADRGMWVSGVVAGDGTVHLAYQDALGDELMYTTWNNMPGTPEVVDDGLRTGDRAHPVGAAASIYLVNGSPSIAYQDGMLSDVVVATKGGSWTQAPLATGPLLDGFSIAATTGHGSPVLAWDTKDPNGTPISTLTVMAP